MKKISLILFMILVSSSMVFAEEVGKITYTEGRVDIVKAGSNMAAPLREGETISVGDSIRTKSNSKAEAVFNDKSSVRMAQNSRVEIKDYQLDEKNKRKTANIMLDRGKIRTKISKMSDSADFVISTPNAQGKVKGSDIFAFYQAGTSGMLVSEGRLAVVNTMQPQAELIVPAGNSVLIPSEELPKGPRPYFELEKKMYEKDTAIPASLPKKEEVTTIKGAISKISGEVKITRKGEDTSHKASINEIISEGDKIVTGDNGFVEIRLDNGNALNLKPNTDLVFVRMAINMKTGQYENTFSSSMGKIKSRIENLKAGSTFSISTPTAVSGARGTIMYLAITPTMIQSFFEGGEGYLQSLISGLEKTVAAGYNAYADDKGSIPDPIPTSDEERVGWGGGWNGEGVAEGYSSPEGGIGIYLTTDDETGIIGRSDPETPTSEGFNPFSDVPFGIPTSGGPVTVVTEPITSSGVLINDIFSYDEQVVDGVFEGLIAVVNTFWNGASADFISAGNFSSDGNDKFTWHSGYLYSYDPANETYTTYDGGAFRGLTGGIGFEADDIAVLDGLAKVIYIDPDGNAGIAGGDLAGIYSNPFGTYLVGGTFTGREISTEIGIPPESLIDSIDERTLDLYFAMPILYENGGVDIDYLDGIKVGISGQDWGIFGIKFGGEYEDESSSTFGSLIFGGLEAEGEEWVGIVAGLKNPDSGAISGIFRGIFSEGRGEGTLIGSMSSDIIGLADSESGWQAVGIGEWDAALALEPVSTIIYQSPVTGFGIEGMAFSFYKQKNGICFIELTGEDGVNGSDFKVAVAGYGDFRYGDASLISIKGTHADNIIDAVFNGIWLSATEDDKARAGTMTGDVVGYIDVEDGGINSWQAVGAGEWVEVTELLDMGQLGFNMTTLGNFVSMPITEVYSSTLTGAGAFTNPAGGAISLTMDMSLYATAPDALQGIWSALINGTYISPQAQAPGENWTWTAIVNNGPSETATLTGTQWQDNQWLANVSGTTETGTNFTGQAGGTYGDGNFSGVGAGKWNAPISSSVTTTIDIQ